MDIQSLKPGTPPTLAEYRQLDLTRPLTDGPVGSTTVKKRAADAIASEVHRPTDSPVTAAWRQARADPPPPEKW